MHLGKEQLVSIVIPCYNAQRWVGEAIESALQQTHSKTEIIVIDDGSTDGSVGVLEQFGRRISWQSVTHRGPCAARNIGLGAARGEWIQFLDADDLLHPDKLSRSLQISEDFPQIEFVWAPHVSIDEDFSVHNIQAARSEADTEVVLSENALLAHYAPSMAMFRMKFVQRVGRWNESLTRWVDLEYHARIATLNPRYARLKTQLYFYRQHGGERISNSNRDHSNIDKALDSLKLTRAVLEASSISPADWKSYLWALYLQLARSSAAHGDRQMFFTLLQESANLRGSPKFQLKCHVAAMSARILGLRTTTALVEKSLRSRLSI